MDSMERNLESLNKIILFKCVRYIDLFNILLLNEDYWIVNI